MSCVTHELGKRFGRNGPMASGPPSQDQIDYINDLAQERRLPLISHMPAGSTWQDAAALVDRLRLLPPDPTVPKFTRRARGVPATPPQCWRLARAQEAAGLPVKVDGLTKFEASRAIGRLEKAA